MERVRWGVLGTASIARRQAIPSIQSSQSGVLQAIASRDYAKAAQMAEEFDIPKAFGSYEELIESDTIDAIYIPLPNDMHLHWTVAAARAGKHVLCEKPLGLNAQEIRTIQQVSAETGARVMEGVASHFHPVHQSVVRKVQEGAIGDPRFIRMSLGWSFQGKRDDYRWKREHGGGGLLDIGCYCVSHSRMIAGSEPEWAVATATFDPHTEIDTNMGILLSFPGGLTSLIDCGILTASRNLYEVIGSTGKITVETPFGNGNRSRKWSLYDTWGNVADEEVLTANQFDVQMESVSRSLREAKPLPISLDESLANIRVLDACDESARRGGVRVDLAE